MLLFSCSVVSSSLKLLDWSKPGFPVLHHLLKFAETHVHWAGDAIQPSCPLSSPSPPAFNLSQHRGLFWWVSSLHQVAKVLELQHQSFLFITGTSSNSCTSRRWCHPTISFSVVPFFSSLPSFPASGSFLMIQFSYSGSNFFFKNSD